MAGLVPAIHDFLDRREGVDARHKAGHDEFRVSLALAFLGPAPDIENGRLAVDEPLANRVRSGRKQP